MKLKGNLTVRLDGHGRGEVLLDDRPFPYVAEATIRLKPGEANRVEVVLLLTEVLVELEDTDVEIRPKLIER